MRLKSYLNLTICPKSDFGQLRWIMPPGKPYYVTAEGLLKMKQELQELKTVKRREVAEKVNQAKELGDLSENAEYQEAKEQLAFIAGRIQELENQIPNAVIIAEGERRDTVGIGTTVVAKLDAREVTYQIVGSEEADPSAGRISNESPLGIAFLGKRVGDEVVVTTPAGETKYKILRIE